MNKILSLVGADPWRRQPCATEFNWLLSGTVADPTAKSCLYDLFKVTSELNGASVSELPMRPVDFFFAAGHAGAYWFASRRQVSADRAEGEHGLVSAPA
jgi:hypothetical protein